MLYESNKLIADINVHTHTRASTHTYTHTHTHKSYIVEVLVLPYTFPGWTG